VGIVDHAAARDPHAVYSQSAKFTVPNFVGEVRPLDAAVADQSNCSYIIGLSLVVTLLYHHYYIHIALLSFCCWHHELRPSVGPVLNH